MIHFGTIEIVELPMVIGDNPSTIGVPITVDWWYPCDMEGDDDNDERHTRTRRGLVQSIPNEYKRILPLDVYEKERSTRRSRKQLHWSRQAREEMYVYIETSTLATWIMGSIVGSCLTKSYAWL